MASFSKALRMERAEREGRILRRRSAAAHGGHAPERTWRQRLERMRSYPSTKQVRRAAGHQHRDGEYRGEVVKNRLHLDVGPFDRSTEARCSDFAAEGNEFCVLCTSAPWKRAVGEERDAGAEPRGGLPSLGTADRAPASGAAGRAPFADRLRLAPGPRQPGAMPSWPVRRR